MAEKPSVARTVTDILAQKNYNKLPSLSKYNPVFDFHYKIKDQEYLMKFTSVSGHLMNYDFKNNNKKWVLEEIKSLYKDEMIKTIMTGSEDIATNLNDLAQNIDVLILWLDCDREGENIAYEVIDVVKNVNPKVKVLRAKFSALTVKDIKESIDNLVEPNKNISDAVELRQKIDLLIGSSFTRLQTLCFRNLLFVNPFYKNYTKRTFEPNDAKRKVAMSVVSYGPCQFPTLNFIVERALKIQEFKPESFSYFDLKVGYQTQNQTSTSDNKHSFANFTWERQRLFDKEIVKTLHEKVFSNTFGTIEQVLKKPKTKYRPVPLNTLELQKLASSKLKIASHITMSVAEKLYQKGYISYPRTDTQKYSNTQIGSLRYILSVLAKGTGYSWCEYAKNLKDFNRPIDGRIDDKSHPPIHPVKFVSSEELSDLEKKIYELIVIHFLATISQNALGEEVVITANIADEIFKCKGLKVDTRGYLNVYPYDTFSDNIIPEFKEKETFKLTQEDIENTNGKKLVGKITLKEGNTVPPYNLTETDLITLMDKNGIGTDSTIHEHIKNVQERGYAQRSGAFLIPTKCGMALIHAYKVIKIELYKPYLRASMEKLMKEVSEGKIDYTTTYEKMKIEMEKIFDLVYEKIPIMTEAIKTYYVYEDKTIESLKDKVEFNSICPECEKSKLNLRVNKLKKSYFVGCSGFPSCKYIQDINSPIQIEKLDKKCKQCDKTEDYYKCTYSDSNIKPREICFSCSFNNNPKPQKPKRAKESKVKQKLETNSEKPTNKKRLSTKTVEDIQMKEEKVCPICKITGRHPKGSTCKGVKRRTLGIKNNNPNEFLV